MSNTLPPGQTRILTFFADAEDDGRQPSRAEVAEAMGYAFPSAVSKHVEALVRKGLLEADREKKRNVKLTQAGWTAINRTPAKQGVPVLGAIAAGTPVLASENCATWLSEIAPAPGRFALKVRGDSMVNVGILDGDFAIIAKGGEVRDGQIGAIRIGEEATLKRVHYHQNHVELISENTAYAPRIVPRDQMAAEGFEVVGPLVFVFRTV